MELSQLDRLIDYLNQKGDTESLVELQEALIQRSDLIEKLLWSMYQRSA